ncbi:MAG: type IIL restriction-modification enzyme MmeI, partial [Candidatus Acidiferrum sp.]
MRYREQNLKPPRNYVRSRSHIARARQADSRPIFDSGNRPRHRARLCYHPPMPLSWNEIRHRAIAFSKEWTGEKSERAEKQTFWNEFFDVFGVRRMTPTDGAASSS